jgi:SAM-dependent methyltransferase
MVERSSKAAWEKLWQKRKRIYHYQNVVEIASQVSQSLAGARVLEVGCGRGATLLEFAKRGAIVTGVDYAESALGFCNSLKEKADYSGNLGLAEFILGDARSLPFPEDKFDIVYSVGLLEHFEDPGAILAEQCRVLKSGGHLILQVPQKYSMYTLLKKVLMAVGKWPYGAWETQFSGRDLRSLVAEAGLSAEFAYGYGSFTLALLRHCLFPTLDYGIGGWHKANGALAGRIRANIGLDVGVVARKTPSSEPEGLG